MFNLRISQAAAKSLRKAPREVAARIRARLDELAEDPFAAPNVRKLTGHPGYRLRVGDWRVLYLVERGVLVIYVIEVGHRKEIYR